MKHGRLIIAMMFLVASCGNDSVDASGEIVTDPRDVGSFDSVDASQGVSVRVVVDPTAPPAVTVKYDDNLLDHVTTRVAGDTLEVRLDASVSFAQGADRYVEVIVADLTHIDVSNGANLSGSGTTPTLALNASGGANVDLTALEVARADVDLSGGANINLRATEAVEGSASGGAQLTVLGDARVDVDTSGGASVTGS